MGKHTMDEIYSKVEQKELNQLAQTLKLVQNRPPTGGGINPPWFVIRAPYGQIRATLYIQ